MPRLLALLLILALCCPWGLTPAYAQTASDEKDWKLNLKDVELPVFLEQVSSITGENFVIDPQVKGKVSVIATTPMRADAVHELMLSVLRVNGYAAVPAGPVTRIVPQANLKMGAVTPARAAGDTQQLVTRVLKVKSANVNEMVRILRPLLSASGYMEGSEFSNSLIISDYGDNVEQIMKAMRAFSTQQSTADIEVIPLREVWVGDIVPLIEAIAPMQLQELGKGRNTLRIVADERNNSIIVRGDRKEREQIRSLIEKFDIRNEEANNIQMIRLHYADARDVASLLKATLGSKPQSEAASAPAGTAAPSAGATSQVPALAEGGGDSHVSIQANVTLNSIIVRADPAVMNEIRALVKQLDVRRPQVLIEAAIVEITADKTRQLGTQLAGGNTAVTYNGGTTQFSGANLVIGDMLDQLGNAGAANVSGEGLAVLLGTKAGFNILLQALSSTTGANLLSTPSIITLDNEEAKIVVGQNVPFRTGSFSTQNAGVSNPFTTIERQDIGITLKVMPQIHEGNLVKMNIEQEVSSIAPTTSQTSGAADLVTNKRTIQTKVLAQDGETIVLGGLIQDDVSEVDSKVPLLGDIPVVGTLFSNRSQSSTKKNLLVFLRPTVLRSQDNMGAITQERFGRVYDLILGRQDILSGDATVSAATQDPGQIFHVPPKELPWLLEGISDKSSESIESQPPPSRSPLSLTTPR